MKNYHQAGDIIEMPAPADVQSGQAVCVNGLPCVAQGPAIQGEVAQFAVTGVFYVRKAHWTKWKAGQRLFWRNNVQGFITHDITPQVDDVTHCGATAWQAAEETAEYGLVRLAGVSGVISTTGGSAQPPAPTPAPAPAPAP